jgi:transposase
LHQFEVILNYWVVERSFAWLEEYRQLWKNAARKINTSMSFVHLTFSTIAEKILNRLLDRLEANTPKKK